MPKPKIDRVKLSRMLTSGKPQKEIAQVFGVTEGAISKAKKELNISVVKNVALESAHKVVDQHLDTLGQLNHINSCAIELLDLLMAWQRGDDEALRILESQVREVKVGRGEDAETVKQYRFRDPRELALKAMGEIRQQLALQLDIFKVLTDTQTVKEFQLEVLSAIGEVAPDMRVKIVEKLKERRALRRSVSIN